MRITPLLLVLSLLLLTAFASAEPAHTSWVHAALERVPVSKRDNTPERLEQRAANLPVFAAEIARVSLRAPLAPRIWSSLLIAQGSIETNFDTEVVAGRCLKFQCDPKLVKGQPIFRAAGAFQQHEVSYVADLWSIAGGNIHAQVEMADRTLRRSLTRCKRFASFPAHVFRAYYGGSCSWPVAREAERVATYERVMRTVAKADGAS